MTVTDIRIKLSAVGVLCLLTGCTDGRSAQLSQTAVPQTQITDVSEQLLTTTAYYSFTENDSTLYGVSSATVQLLTRFGDEDLRPLYREVVDNLLPDSLPSTSANVDSAMQVFVSDTLFISENMDCNLRRISALPEGAEERAYSREMSIKIAELTHEYVTYNRVFFLYTGGAHPFRFLAPFTYLFKERVILDMDNLFLPGSESRLQTIVTETLLSQINPPVSTLTEAGYFVDRLPVPEIVSLRGGELVFTYSLYEIAPYVMGTPEIVVSPYDLSDLLTLLGHRLLIDDVATDR